MVIFQSDVCFPAGALHLEEWLHSLDLSEFAAIDTLQSSNVAMENALFIDDKVLYL